MYILKRSPQLVYLTIIASHSYSFSLVMRTSEIYCPSNFQICVTVSWATVLGDLVFRCTVKSRASLSRLGQAVRTCISRTAGEVRTLCVFVSGAALPARSQRAGWSAHRRAQRTGLGSVSADPTATRSKHPPAPRCRGKASSAYRFSPSFSFA